MVVSQFDPDKGCRARQSDVGFMCAFPVWWVLEEWDSCPGFHGFKGLTAPDATDDTAGGDAGLAAGPEAAGFEAESAPANRCPI
jgi:hypothetical protein